MDFTEFWDNTVKAVAKDVCETCKIDGLVGFYVSQMVFYVEHDLADDRDPHFRLYPCIGTLNNEDYYKNVHAATSQAEVEKLRNFGKLLNELSNKRFVSDEKKREKA
jgi:hypothetical protein